MEKARFHISFSEYRLFLGCEHKHFLTKTLGYQEGSNEFLIFGSALHAAIEDVILKKPPRMMLGKVFEEKLKKETNNVVVKSYFGNKFKEQGEAILRDLDFHNRYAGYEIVGVEQDIYEPLYEDETHEVYFKGFIDLILKKDDKYLILDWKSAAKPWSLEDKYKVVEESEGVFSFPDEIKNDSDEKSFFGQVALYKHFISKKFNVPLENIETAFVALPKEPVGAQQYDVIISQEYQDFVLEDVKRVAKEIATVNPLALKKAKLINKKSSCQYCPFKKEDICNDDQHQVVDFYNKEK